ncbi:MAG: sulfatase [Armatimonadota bacterium]|nr:sulfatase [Armatimonadota bacterium]
MNVILILIDSCNRHYLSPYGCRDVRTRNIQELADRGVTFTNHFLGSAPCMPARRELMTGRREFLWRGWGPIEPFDRPLALECRKLGAVTQIITDHYHYWEISAHGYLEYFDGSEMIRGHELDYWKTAPQPQEPDWVLAINKYRPGWGSRYYRNVAHFKTVEDFHSPTVFRKAAEWIDANVPLIGRQPFYLHVESFDAHEPFYVPEPYRSMYTDDLNPAYTCWPPYQNAQERLAFLRNTSLAELEFIRAQYKGKLTMVDDSIGLLWQAMDRHDLWRDTMVILTTDHGHELAEAIKSLDEITEDGRDHTLRCPFGKQHPHYLSHANIPLIVWHPELANDGRRVDAVTCGVDLYATVLEALGAKNHQALHSRSILPILRGEDAGRSLTYWGTFGAGICCTDGDYVLLQGARAGFPLCWYSAHMRTAVGSGVEAGQFIPGVECPVWRIESQSSFEFPSILYRKDDPLFDERNIIDQEPETTSAIRRKLRQVISEDGCPPEQFERLEL